MFWCCYGGSTQYTGTGYIGRGGSGGTTPTGYRVNGPPSSKPGSSGSGRSTHSYGASYGYGSPGTVPVPRGGRPAGGPAGARQAPGGGASARFCFDCGAKFPTPSAKFCCECGMARQS